MVVIMQPRRRVQPKEVKLNYLLFMWNCNVNLRPAASVVAADNWQLLGGPKLDDFREQFRLYPQREDLRL
jgi:hypothetical protein